MKKFLISTLIVFILSVLFVTNSVSGSSSEKQQSEVYYQTVTILSGDTLWGLAEKYNNNQYPDIRNYIYEIKKFNNLNSDVIIAGESIVIPITIR